MLPDHILQEAATTSEMNRWGMLESRISSGRASLEEHQRRLKVANEHLAGLRVMQMTREQPFYEDVNGGRVLVFGDLGEKTTDLSREVQQLNQDIAGLKTYVQEQENQLADLRESLALRIRARQQFEVATNQ